MYRSIWSSNRAPCTVSRLQGGQQTDSRHAGEAPLGSSHQYQGLVTPSSQQRCVWINAFRRYPKFLKIEVQCHVFCHAQESNGNQTLHSLWYWLEMHATFKTFLECRNSHTKPKSTSADPSNPKCLSNIETRPFHVDAKAEGLPRGWWHVDQSNGAQDKGSKYQI